MAEHRTGTRRRSNVPRPLRAPPKPGIYDIDLERRPANYSPLTPITFLARAGLVHSDKVAIVDGQRRITYAEFFARCRRLASALERRGVGKGDTVAFLASNVPALLEGHFGVAMAGAVLNPLNVRQDARNIAFALGHAEAKVLVTDPSFSDTVEAALAAASPELLVVDTEEPQAGDGCRLGSLTYEELLAEGDHDYDYKLPDDEWDAISLLYTSGTTGNPKGVVYHHRGAYLNSLANALAFNLRSDSVYLWTLPMFHCNGWTFTWAVTAMGATHVCLRGLEPGEVFELIEKHEVTHLNGAPVVLSMLINAPSAVKRRFSRIVEVGTGGAAPPSAVIGAMESMGFRVTHLYGATETYGPATFCERQPAWTSMSLEDRAKKIARQGVPVLSQSDWMVADPETLEPVPQDGETLGELMMRGSTVMKGYLKNPSATEATLRGGWYHSGDLAVWYSDGYIEIRDRSKDVIISGGENVSSLEIEEILARHPAVMGAAVVAMPHAKWGEVPCAFVEPKPNEEVTDADLIAFCRQHLAGFKVPKTVVMGALPKTATGKVQKFRLRDRARDLHAKKGPAA